MCLEPIPTQYVHQISDEEKQNMLKTHFTGFFALFCESNLEFTTPSSPIHRYLSGIPFPALNAVIGTPQSDSEACIERQLLAFQEIKTPFLWYVDESSPAEFKKNLSAHGFQDVGICQGVIGPLDQTIRQSELSEGCVIERVETEDSLEKFSELVCSTFEVRGESKRLYKEVLGKLSSTEPPLMFHWMARKDGVIVAAISTYIDGPIVSFWNGATLPSMRRQGFSTAIRRAALQDAVSRGCTFGASYLMSEGLALGICSQLGYETKWRYHAFLSP